MFYALQKHREWREEREQRQAQLRADALAKGRAEERQRTEAWLTRVAEKEGIPLERLLPPADEDGELCSGRLNKGGVAFFVPRGV